MIAMDAEERDGDLSQHLFCTEIFQSVVVIEADISKDNKSLSQN